MQSCHLAPITGFGCLTWLRTFFLQEHLKLTMGMLERFSVEERLLLKQTYAWYLERQRGRMQVA